MWDWHAACEHYLWYILRCVAERTLVARKQTGRYFLNLRMSRKALVKWDSDNYLSVINADAVVEGKTELGAKIKANYMKETYTAIILEVNKL